LRLNEYKLCASLTAAGKLFHTTGPATEKALSPNFVLVRGTEVVSTGRRMKFKVAEVCAAVLSIVKLASGL